MRRMMEQITEAIKYLFGIHQNTEAVARRLGVVKLCKFSKFRGHHT